MTSRATSHAPFEATDHAFERDVGSVYRALMSVRSASDEPVLGVQIGDSARRHRQLEAPGRQRASPTARGSLQRARAAVTLRHERGVAASRRMFAYDAAVVARRPHVPHFYLLGIAVIRTEQGNDYGVCSSTPSTRSSRQSKAPRASRWTRQRLQTSLDTSTLATRSTDVF